MASNNSNRSKQDSQVLQQYKTEASNEVGVDLSRGGNLTAREAGLVGGHMVRNMIAKAKGTMGTTK